MGFVYVYSQCFYSLVSLFVAFGFQSFVC